MPPAARVSDMHTCPMVTPGTPPIPHVGGPIIPPCKVNVLIGYLPAARVTDKCICVGPMDMIIKGSPTVLIGGLMAARIGDNTTHGGVIVTGQFNVLIGDTGGGSAGGGGIAGSGGTGGVASPLSVTFGEALTAAAEQAQALVGGAASGKPFCAICAKNG